MACIADIPPRIHASPCRYVACRPFWRSSPGSHAAHPPVASRRTVHRHFNGTRQDALPERPSTLLYGVNPHYCYSVNPHYCYSVSPYYCYSVNPYYCYSVSPYYCYSVDYLDTEDGQNGVSEPRTDAARGAWKASRRVRSTEKEDEAAEETAGIQNRRNPGSDMIISGVPAAGNYVVFNRWGRHRSAPDARLSPRERLKKKYSVFRCAPVIPERTAAPKNTICPMVMPESSRTTAHHALPK